MLQGIAIRTLIRAGQLVESYQAIEHTSPEQSGALRGKATTMILGSVDILESLERAQKLAFEQELAKRDGMLADLCGLSQELVKMAEDKS